MQGGADENDILSAKVRYNGTSDEYVKFSRAIGLPQQRQRVTVDGLRNVGQLSDVEKVLDKINKNGIINSINTDSLQHQLPYVYRGEKNFIPNHTVFASEPKIIAGKGTKTKIKVVDKLVSRHGGKPTEWAKKVAKIESAKYIFDVHWYDYVGAQFDMKLKHRKEK